MRIKPIVLLVVFIAVVNVYSVHRQSQAQTAPAAVKAQKVDEAQLDKLPPSLRERGRRLLSESDETVRTRLARDLARETQLGSLDFLLSVFATDTSLRVRSEILDRASRLRDPRVLKVLQETAAADPDIELALLALEHLREDGARELGKLLTRRIDKARTNGNEGEFHKLAQEHERWISLMRGTMLPTFMRVPPPVFAVKRADEPVRVLAFGDFGNGSPEQKQVAEAMQGFHRRTPFDFGLTLGDNFYT
ncbi:MAG: hypothetical protein ABI882_22615, partial [Acidobacteriota bacterium]